MTKQLLSLQLAHLFLNDLFLQVTEMRIFSGKQVDSELIFLTNIDVFLDKNKQ